MSTLAVNNITEVGGEAVVTSGVLDSGSLPAGSVLQVVSTTKTDAFSTTAIDTWTDVTDLEATITPRSTSSKIFCSVEMGHVDASGVTGINFRLARNGTPVGVGDQVGSLRLQISFGTVLNSNNFKTVTIEKVNATESFSLSGGTYDITVQRIASLPITQLGFTVNADSDLTFTQRGDRVYNNPV